MYLEFFVIHQFIRMPTDTVLLFQKRKFNLGCL